MTLGNQANRINTKRRHITLKVHTQGPYQRHCCSFDLNLGQTFCETSHEKNNVYRAKPMIGFKGRPLG